MTILCCKHRTSGKQFEKLVTTLPTERNHSPSFRARKRRRCDDHGTQEDAVPYTNGVQLNHNSIPNHRQKETTTHGYHKNLQPKQGEIDLLTRVNDIEKALSTLSRAPERLSTIEQTLGRLESRTDRADRERSELNGAIRDISSTNRELLAFIRKSPTHKPQPDPHNPDLMTRSPIQSRPGHSAMGPDTPGRAEVQNKAAAVLQNPTTTHAELTEITSHQPAIL